MAEIILNESPENELDVSNQGNNETENLDEIQTASFLKVSELKLKCRARNLRLKEDDVIVAVDGEPSTPLGGGDVDDCRLVAVLKHN